MRKNVLKVLIASLCFSALIGIIIILTGTIGEIEGKILGTTLTIFAFSILGLCCSTIYENPKYKSFSKFGMLVCLFACIWSILIIWELVSLCLIFCNGDDFTGRVLWTLTVISSSAAHISLMLLLSKNNNIVNNIVNITIFLSVVIDIMILLIAWDIAVESDLYLRMILVIAILITLGTIVSPIINKIYKNNTNNSIK